MDDVPTGGAAAQASPAARAGTDGGAGSAAAGGAAGRDLPARDLPLPDIARQLPEQVSRLVRDELRLARLEMTQKGKRAGVGAGMFGAAGLMALYGAAALLAAIVLLLAEAIPAWGGALIVAGALFAASAAAALAGRAQMRHATPPVPQQTAQSVKADVEQIKERAQR